MLALTLLGGVALCLMLISAAVLALWLGIWHPEFGRCPRG